MSPGGIFYFGEEPIKQDFQLSLWRRGYRLTRWEKILKLIGILPFLSRIGKAEVSQGILEEEFPLSIWREALDVFQTVNLEVKPVFFGPKSPLIKSSFCWSNLNLIVLILIALQGGGINGFAIKEGKDKHLKDPIRFLACPDCYKAITKTDKGFYCQGCQREFYNKDGVLMFLPWELHKKLYG